MLSTLCLTLRNEPRTLIFCEGSETDFIVAFLGSGMTSSALQRQLTGNSKDLATSRLVQWGRGGVSLTKQKAHRRARQREEGGAI